MRSRSRVTTWADGVVDQAAALVDADHLGEEASSSRSSQVRTDGGGFSTMARWQRSTQPPQMWTPGPATSRSTSASDLPQKEQWRVWPRAVVRHVSGFT